MNEREQIVLEEFAENMKKLDEEARGFIRGYATAKAEDASKKEVEE